MTTTVNVSAPVEKPSILKLLFSIIDKPKTTFEMILARPNWSMWVVPLLILMVAFAALVVVQTPYTMEMARQQMDQQLATLPPDQAEAARSATGFTLSYPFILATTLGFGALALFIGILVQAAFLYFGALMLGGDDTNFGSVFTMSVWTRLPMAIGLLVLAGFTLATRRLIQFPGLAFLVTSGDPVKDAGNPLVVLLSRIDLFWFWHLLLVGIGLAVVTRLTRGNSFLLTVIYAALALGMAVLPSLIFGGFAG